MADLSFDIGICFRLAKQGPAPQPRGTTGSHDIRFLLSIRPATGCKTIGTAEWKLGSLHFLLSQRCLVHLNRDKMALCLSDINMTDDASRSIDVAQMFKSHRRDLLRFLKSRGFTEDLAADVSQDAFLRLLTHTQTSDIKNKKGYLFRIAANLGIDLRRRQAREGWHEAIDADAIEIVDDRPSVERVLISRQELAALSKAFDEVPPGPQAVFLARLEGLTFAEIEKRQGVPLKTAFSQAMKVMLFLKSRLDDLEKHPHSDQKKTPADRH